VGTERQEACARTAVVPPILRRALLAGALVATGAVSTATAAAPQEPVRPEDSRATEAPPLARPAPVEVAPAASEIRVDGVLDEPAWQEAAVVPVPWEWFPGDNAPAPVDTEALVTFDGERLYVAFRAADPRPGEIRAHLADRDSAFDDDQVGFLLDTFDDRRRAFEFRVNPLGVQYDAVVSDVDDSTDWDWDAIWDSAGRIGPAGYTVEVAVPLAQLRLPRADAAGAQTWGFLALRQYPRSVGHELRSVRRDRDLDCLVCQAGRLVGFRGVEPGLDLELDPTLTLLRTDARDPFREGELRAGDEEAEAGLTARWNPTPAVALQAALNPDFSQVEADSAQLDVNTRFALFFPEKRPFFLEGTDLFSTPLPAVFTRTIADPSYGLKVTGKEGRHAFAALVAEDEVTNLIFPANQGSSSASLAADVTAGVARYRLDVGKTSTVGLLWTGREGDGYGNHVAGIDGALRLTDSDTLRFQGLASHTRYPAPLARDAGQPLGGFDGAAWRLDYEHGERDWYWSASYHDVDRDFRADSGFMPQVDVRRGQAGVQRTFYGEPDDWYRRFYVFLGADATRDQSGEIEEWGGDLVLTYQGPMQSEVSLGLAPNEEYFDGVTYDNFRQSVFAGFRPSGSFGLGARVGWGESIDFANSRQADFVSVEPEIALNLGRRVEATVAGEWTRFEVAPGRLFTARLAQARIVYHFGLRTFLRAIVQHEDVERNSAVYLRPVDSESEEVFTQLLFSYKLNPRTVLLVGTTDDRLGRTDPQGVSVGLTERGRTYFLKLGYALLF